MANYFIDRPVFAWVIALFIILFGVIAIPNLPIARYPSVAPPREALNKSTSDQRRANPPTPIRQWGFGE